MEFDVFDLGLIDFKRVWLFQKELLRAVKDGLASSGLITCRHYPVITVGRMAKKKNILVSQEELQARDICVYEIERGGDVTYHGPGQITVYPVFDLRYSGKDIGLFLRKLEQVTIDLLLDYGICACRYPGLTGAWIKKHKIASIGIAVKNWIAYHGLSINIKKSDLDNFNLIKPCGMDVEMTSLESVLNTTVDIENVKERLMLKFGQIFN